jgi:molybdopterin molybdotransferase
MASLAESLDRVLAGDITSDIDSPPHDKAMVDGYAAIAADFAGGSAELSILEEVTAGAVPTLTVSSGHCTRIMTGAPLPAGADAVIMVEHTELTPDGSRVCIAEQAKSGQNIMVKAASLRRGEVVLSAGQDRVAVLSTGNELVEADRQPAAGQIRNSNGPLLAAAVRRAGGVPIELGIARDNISDLRDKIGRGLGSDILVLSGGVSAGVLDLVPGVLRELGVEQVFHKVNLKPGKPLWFGVTGSRFRVQGSKSESGSLKPETLKPEPETLVFGLPGNPVSSLVCFELFIRPAIAKVSGRNPDAGNRRVRARLAGGFAHRGDRPTYYPAFVRRDGDDWSAEPVAWRGSADLCGLTRANALIPFPAGDRAWQDGDVFDVLLL